MNKVIIAVSALLGVIITLAVCNIFSGNREQQPIITKGDIITDIQHAEKTAASFNRRKDSLSAHAVAMDAALKQATQQQETARQQQLQLRSQASRLTGQQRVLIKNKDTVAVYENTDTLVATIDELVAANDLQQKACDAVTGNLTLQLQNRDSAIAVHKEEQVYIMATLNESFTKQQLLQSQVKLLNKQLRRKKLVSKLQSAGLVAVSALVVKLLAK